MVNKIKRDKKTGCPQVVKADIGSEIISKALDKWAYKHQVTFHFSCIRKSRDNAFIESFNGRFRQKCLNTYWFLLLDDSKSKLKHGHRGITRVVAILHWTG